MNPAPDDRDLMLRIAQRDQMALQSLHAQYAAAMFGLALRVLNDRPLAEEALQDVLLKVWNRPDTWDASKGRLLSWLLTITRYTAIDLLRRERLHTRGRLESLENAAHIADETAHGGEQGLRLLVDQLPPEERRLVTLAFFQGLTHSELAEYTGLPLGTIKTRLRRGLQRLRAQWLGTTEESGGESGRTHEIADG